MSWLGEKSPEFFGGDLTLSGRVSFGGKKKFPSKGGKEGQNLDREKKKKKGDRC